jgi:hypothetical protein
LPNLIRPEWIAVNPARAIVSVLRRRPGRASLR